MSAGHSSTGLTSTGMHQHSAVVLQGLLAGTRPHAQTIHAAKTVVARSLVHRQPDLPVRIAVRPGCSTGSGITLVRPAIQRQFVMATASNPRPARRANDRQMILILIRLDPGLDPDLVFLVGAAGIEPATPRL